MNQENWAEFIDFLGQLSTLALCDALAEKYIYLNMSKAVKLLVQSVSACIPGI